MSEEALEALRRIDIHKSTPGYSVECKALYENHAETIRSALQSPQIDLESLKKKYTNAPEPTDEDAYVCGWNACIDHLKAIK